MTISASMVKELRERTGAGMMDCKKALGETDGDLDAAVELLRVKGAASADKKAGRVASEGAVFAVQSADKKSAFLVEINSETDFVAKDDNFIAFGQKVAQYVADSDISDVEALGEDMDKERRDLIAKIGENIQVRRIVKAASENGKVALYQHGSKIAVVVDYVGGDEQVARDVAMQVAATSPLALDESEIDAEVVAKERAIYLDQAKESGKPAEIAEKMVEGRVNKFLKEQTLVNQPFVKNPDQTVAKYVAENDTTLNAYARIEVGEGIEKVEEDFAAEVMSQIKGS